GVRLDGVLGNAELGGDLPIAKAGCDQREHLAFARCQAGYLGAQPTLCSWPNANLATTNGRAGAASLAPAGGSTRFPARGAFVSGATHRESGRRARARSGCLRPPPSAPPAPFALLVAARRRRAVSASRRRGSPRARPALAS